MLRVVFISVSLFFALPAQAQLLPDAKVDRVEWDDGDSGELYLKQGQSVRFRLYQHDAPETMPIGMRGGAKCTAERLKGYASKAFMEGITIEGVAVSDIYGMDHNGRELVDLVTGQVNVAYYGRIEGHLKEWVYHRTEKLMDKPNWCGEQ